MAVMLHHFTVPEGLRIDERHHLRASGLCKEKRVLCGGALGGTRPSASVGPRGPKSLEGDLFPENVLDAQGDRCGGIMAKRVNNARTARNRHESQDMGGRRLDRRRGDDAWSRSSRRKDGPGRLAASHLLRFHNPERIGMRWRNRRLLRLAPGARLQMGWEDPQERFWSASIRTKPIDGRACPPGPIASPGERAAMRGGFEPIRVQGSVFRRARRSHASVLASRILKCHSPSDQVQPAKGG